MEGTCEALREAVADAGLLVLGNRGRSLEPLGGTSSEMLRVCSLPVAVVPGLRSRG